MPTISSEPPNKPAPNDVTWIESIARNDITAAALLNRSVRTAYTAKARKMIFDSTILVTGAGGSIGSEIVRQLRLLDAARVICIDRDEYALYTLQRGLTGAALLTDSEYILADVRDYSTLSNIMIDTNPSIVFHAAAHKHLPLLEKSPEAAILTNILGTENVAKACIANQVKRFVNISTDKAANPISVLGMSKRLAEMTVKAYAGKGTRIASVRFGNVLGSRGSFVETFAWQLASGRAVTITDQGMSRFFMTIPQAAGLVVEAAQLSDDGATFVLDMGIPIKITELVERYAKLSGHNNLDIEYTGLREGEKLHEELFDPSEKRRDTPHPKISEVLVGSGADNFLENLHALYDKALSGTPGLELRDALEVAINSEQAVHKIEAAA